MTKRKKKMPRWQQRKKTLSPKFLFERITQLTNAIIGIQIVQEGVHRALIKKGIITQEELQAGVDAYNNEVNKFHKTAASKSIPEVVEDVVSDPAKTSTTPGAEPEAEPMEPETESVEESL